jgi:hypothetical protein
MRAHILSIAKIFEEDKPQFKEIPSSKQQNRRMVTFSKV